MEEDWVTIVEEDLDTGKWEDFGVRREYAAICRAGVE